MNNRVYAPHLRRRKKDKKLEIREPTLTYAPEDQKHDDVVPVIDGPASAANENLDKFYGSNVEEAKGWLGKTRVFVRRRRATAPK